MESEEVSVPPDLGAYSMTLHEALECLCSDIDYAILQNTVVSPVKTAKSLSRVRLFLLMLEKE